MGTLLTWGSYRRARSTSFLDGHRWAFVQVAPGGTGKAGLHRGHMAGASCGRLLYKLISGERRFWSIIRSTGRRNTHHIGKKNLFTTKGGGRLILFVIVNSFAVDLHLHLTRLRFSQCLQREFGNLKRKRNCHELFGQILVAKKWQIHDHFSHHFHWDTKQTISDGFSAAEMLQSAYLLPTVHLGLLLS